MIYRVVDLEKSDRINGVLSDGDILCKSLGSCESERLVNMSGIFVDIMFTDYNVDNCKDFVEMAFKVLKTIEILLSEVCDGDYVKYIKKVYTRLKDDLRVGILDARHFQKYKDMWCKYKDGVCIEDYYFLFSSSYSDSVSCFKDAVGRAKVSNNRRVSNDKDEYWLSDDLGIDVEYANAVNMLMGVLLYMSNCTSYKTGEYCVHDEVEITTRYDNAMFLASIPYRRVCYEESRGIR